MYTGILNIYKEKGFTSHDVVAKLRGILHQKKVGHTGTLDPDATGVLLVVLGNATRASDFIMKGTKIYKATMQLGISTDTEDTSGTVLKEGDKELIDALSDGDIENAINSFVGEYDQLPPMYSAIRVNGKKLYEYARAGQEVERKPRHIVIESIENIQINKPFVSFDVICQSGTYIRSLCRDIGDKLGTFAAMSELERVKVGAFDKESAYTLSQVEAFAKNDQVENVIVDLDLALKDYEKIVVKPEFDKLLHNGNKIAIHGVIEGSANDEQLYKIFDSNQRFIGLYKYNLNEKMYVPCKIFNLP